MTAADKGEVAEALAQLMSLPGMIGYVVINFDGIPVKYFPEGEDVIKPVQYAALFSDLVKHTRFALKQLEINDQNSLQGFQSVRMRTAAETEFIVTEFVTPTTQNAYILVAIQSCKFSIDEEIAGDEEEAKEWVTWIVWWHAAEKMKRLVIRKMHGMVCWMIGIIEGAVVTRDWAMICAAYFLL